MKKIKRTILTIPTRKLLLGLALPLLLMALVFANAARARTVNSSAERPAAVVPAAPVAVEANAPLLAPANVSIDLCATTGSVTMPDSTTHAIWGYVEGDCTGAEAGNATIPGPLIEINEGDTLTVTLHNDLAENVSLVFSGQTTPPDYAGAAPAGSATYSFVATNPGTYIYESGVNAAIQTSMGLYGAFVVNSATGGTAYGDATTAYDSQEVLVLSEIDPNLNADPAGFNLLDYLPRYWLINGEAYPDTDLITAVSGGRVLLRYLNVGGSNQTMSLLGANQTVVAQDGYPLAYPYDLVTPILPSGQTIDVIVNVPITVENEQLALYNRHMNITNNGASVPGGGMMTFVDVQPAINFNDYVINSYGGAQDSAGVVPTIEDNGATLRIVGNGWKRIDFPYNATPDTVIEFDFMSGTQGEIHGIGFDTDDTIDNPIQTFQLYGTQTSWGIDFYQDYAADAPAWKHYTIYAGQAFTGAMSYLTFTMDDDGAGLGESAFRNVRVYEEPQPLLQVDGNGYAVENYGGAQNSPGSALATVENNGMTLRILGNGWRRISLPYAVTTATVLEFDFASSVEGEIHAIGLDSDDTIDNPIQGFQLYGTQTWGNQDFNTYTNGDGTVHYSIPVGSYYTGSMLYVFFVMDDDTAVSGESVFSNISLHD